MSAFRKVRYFTSEMSGAPSPIASSAGSLINVLNTCLVNGFGSVTVNSLTVTNAQATAVVNGGHNFLSEQQRPIIRISGADTPELNDDFQITIINSTTFSFFVSGVADGAISGTITAKRAPADWSKPFGDATRSAFQSNAVDATHLYFNVSDGGTEASVTGYVTMTAISTGAEPFPPGGTYLIKGLSPTTSANPWVVVATERSCYVFIRYYLSGTTQRYSGLFFGDFISVVAGDAYNAAVIGATIVSGNQSSYCLSCVGYGLSTTNVNKGVARGYTQTPGAFQPYIASHMMSGVSSGFMGGIGGAYPSPITPGIPYMDVTIWEPLTVGGTNYNLRGILPGLFCPLVQTETAPDKLTFAGKDAHSGREMMYQRCTRSTSDYGGCVIDLTGPWI